MRRAILQLFCLGLAVGPSPPAAPADDASRLWSAPILPLLADHCFKCHGNIETKSGLSLMTPAEVLRGGENGPAVVPGRP
jgi:hypothetical protein